MRLVIQYMLLGAWLEKQNNPACTAKQKPGDSYRAVIVLVVVASFHNCQIIMRQMDKTSD